MGIVHPTGMGGHSSVRAASQHEWFSGGCFGGQWAHGCLAAGRLEDWFFLLAVNISGVHVRIGCGCIPIFARKDWCTQSVQSIFWGTPAFGKVVPGLVKNRCSVRESVSEESRPLKECIELWSLDMQLFSFEIPLLITIFQALSGAWVCCFGSFYIWTIAG